MTQRPLRARSFHGYCRYRGSQLKKYNVYKHPVHGFDATKVGFSWPAFFFSPVWILAEKLWVQAGLWLAALVLLLIMGTVTYRELEGDDYVLVSSFLFAGCLSLWLVPAFRGNQWKVASLGKRGYDWQDDVQAPTPDAAVAQIVSSSTLYRELARSRM